MVVLVVFAVIGMVSVSGAIGAAVALWCWDRKERQKEGEINEFSLH